MEAAKESLKACSSDVDKIIEITLILFLPVSVHENVKFNSIGKVHTIEENMIDLRNKQICTFFNRE